MRRPVELCYVEDDERNNAVWPFDTARRSTPETPWKCLDDNDYDRKCTDGTMRRMEQGRKLKLGYRRKSRKGERRNYPHYDRNHFDLSSDLGSPANGPTLKSGVVSGF